MKSISFTRIIATLFSFLIVGGITLHAQKSKDGAETVTNANRIFNRYATLSASAVAGATTITVGNIADLASGAIAGGSNNPYATAALSPCDLLMIVKMQGADINTTNTAAYGTVSNYNNVGVYEFVEVGSIAGNVITLSSGCSLLNTYNVGGRERVQVIRVPRLSSLTINAGGSLTGRAWGNVAGTGGVVVCEVNGNTIVDGSITANGIGYRGGAIDNSTDFGINVFRSTVNTDGAEKGEGIVGYQADYDGALNGRYGRGAPANGGGGGNAHLGDCYRLTGRWGRAEQWYGKLATGPNPTAEVVYYYAQALRSNGKYEESNQQMTRFYQMSGSDTRAKEHTENPDFHEAIQSQEPYFSIKSLDVNSEKSDFGACWYGSRVVFASARPYRVSKQNFHSYNGSPFLDMYQADRDVNGQLTGVSLLHAGVSTKYHEGPACFSADAKTMYFTRNNFFNGKYGKSSKDINNLKIFRAKWNGTTWTEENLSINSDEFSVGHPCLSADGAWMYFASDMPGGKGETDIWRVALNGDGSLGQPENLAGNVNTEGKEMFPFVDKDGNLYYASDGHLGLGGLDIFYSPADGKGSFGKSINPGLPLNSPSDDFSLVLDGENKAGYFSSNREGGKGDDDIYAITVARPMKPVYKVIGIAKQKGADVILAGVEVSLKDATGKVVETVTTGIDGSYSFTVEQGTDYSIVGAKDKYFDGSAKVNAVDFGDKTELKRDVDLEKDPGLSLYVSVKDKVSGLPLDSVNIRITDNITGTQTANVVTTTYGEYRNPIADKKIGDRISYNVVFERPGYLAKTITVNQAIEKEGEIPVPETMDKIAVGLDLAKIIDIKPIYFDLGKSIIRPDAAIELDKIVKVMNENPNMVVELGSHTDCRSSAASNMALSDRRAKASAEYIKKRITNPDRIYGKGYGEAQLVNGCACEGAVKSTCPEDEHQKNRRTEFKIIKM